MYDFREEIQQVFTSKMGENKNYFDLFSAQIFKRDPSNFKLPFIFFTAFSCLG